MRHGPAAARPARRGRNSSPARRSPPSPCRAADRRNFQAATGTGLAQPNMKSDAADASAAGKISRKPGSRMVPTRSMCAQRIERQPAGVPRGVVAQRQRRVAVRRLVQGDRQHRRDHRQGRSEAAKSVTPAADPVRRPRPRASSGRRRRAASARRGLQAGGLPPAVSGGQRASSSAVGAKSPLQYSARSQPAASACERQVGRRAGQRLHRQVVGHQNSFKADPAADDRRSITVGDNVAGRAAIPGGDRRYAPS